MSYAIKGSWAHDIESIKASDLPKCRGDWESKKFVRKVQSHIPKIKPRRNYWCGPYAMAVLTNTSYEEGLKQVWKHDPSSRSMGMVRGVWNLDAGELRTANRLLQVTISGKHRSGWMR